MLEDYKYRGARACVLLHDTKMRQCLKVWQEAKTKNIRLPQTQDADYQSLEHLLRHILGAARGYMVWICKQLNLPDPEIRPAPEVQDIAAQAEDYLEHVLTQWPKPLRDVPEEQFGPHSYKSNWGEEFSIDSMLEHAVMHPIRHAFQLNELINKQNS